VIVPLAGDGTPGAAQTEPGTSLLFAIDCASLSTCTAVGNADAQNGAVVAIGSAAGPGSAAVAKALSLSGPASSISAILKGGGYPAKFTAPKAGTAQLSLYYVPAGAQLARVKKPVLIARGTKRFSKPGKATIKLALTAQGRALLKKAKTIKLTALGSFTPKGGTAATARKVITLRRR
jgi:hypothetical protein